jgi:hypothetical protein
MSTSSRKTIGVSATVIGAVAMSLLACSGSATDNTPLEPSRDARISSLAASVCDRYGDTGAGCPGFGSGHKYATESDCQRDFEERASELWPANQCSNKQINDAAYQKCNARAQNFACSTGLQSVIDALTALDECKSSNVCTDPAS